MALLTARALRPSCFIRSNAAWVRSSAPVRRRAPPLPLGAAAGTAQALPTADQAAPRLAQQAPSARAGERCEPARPYRTRPAPDVQRHQPDISEPRLRQQRSRSAKGTGRRPVYGGHRHAAADAPIGDMRRAQPRQREGAATASIVATATASSGSGPPGGGRHLAGTHRDQQLAQVQRCDKTTRRAGCSDDSRLSSPSPGAQLDRVARLQPNRRAAAISSRLFHLLPQCPEQTSYFRH